MDSKSTQQIYCVGQIGAMREAFPDRKYREDERHSLDGTQVLFESQLTDEETADLIRRAGALDVRVFTSGDQVRDFLNRSPDWTVKGGSESSAEVTPNDTTDAPRYDRESLSSMRRSTLTEVAESMGVAADTDLTKNDIIHAILKKQSETS